MTSEDANDGFKPTCGSIDELSFRTSPDVWGYFSVKSGGGIHEFSDSQVSYIRRPLFYNSMLGRSSFACAGSSGLMLVQRFLPAFMHDSVTPPQSILGV